MAIGHLGINAEIGQIIVGERSIGDTKDEVLMLHMMESLIGFLLGNFRRDGAYDNVDCREIIYDMEVAVGYFPSEVSSSPEKHKYFRVNE